jgi:steroid delta-isomerase-like uncharacterized protein
MSDDVERNKERNREFFRRVFAEHDADAVDDLLTEDFREHVRFPGFSMDREGARAFFTEMFEAFPDLTPEIHSMVAQGDRVFIRSSFTGTHSKEFLGVPKTGRKITVDNYDIVRMADGRATDHWGIFDVLGMLGQMGMLPGPEDVSPEAGDGSP